MNKINTMIGMPTVYPHDAFERSPKAKPWERIKVHRLYPHNEDDVITRELTRWLNILIYDIFTPVDIALVGRLHKAIVEYPPRLFDRNKLIIEPYAILADLIAYMEEKEDKLAKEKENGYLIEKPKEAPPPWLVQKTEQLLAVREKGRIYTDEEVDRISKRVEELKLIYHKEGLDPGPPLPPPPPIPFRVRKPKGISFRKKADTLYFMEALRSSKNMRTLLGNPEPSAIERTVQR